MLHMSRLGLTLYLADVDKKMKTFFLHGFGHGTDSLALAVGATSSREED